MYDKIYYHLKIFFLKKLKKIIADLGHPFGEEFLIQERKSL